jgi:hypothetical protein
MLVGVVAAVAPIAATREIALKKARPQCDLAFYYLRLENTNLSTNGQREICQRRVVVCGETNVARIGRANPSWFLQTQ